MEKQPNKSLLKGRGPLVAGGLVLLVALIVALVILLQGSPEAAPAPAGTISSTTGEVLVQRQGTATWIIADAGMKLYANDHIKTDGNGTAEIIFFEGSIIEVGGNSEVLVSELAIAPETGSTSIKLQQIVGHTVNRVQKLVDSSSKYEIETPAGSAVVRGTGFRSYVRGEDGYTVVYCDDGTIWFTAGGVTVVLGAGQQSSAMPGGTPSTPSAFRIENLAICSDVLGDRDYTVRTDAEFDPGERAWIYFEAFGLDWNVSNGMYEIWYKVTDVKVYDSEDELYMSVTDPADFHRTELDKLPNYLWGALYLDLLPGTSSGQYETILAFEDVVSGQTHSVTVNFSVR